MGDTTAQQQLLKQGFLGTTMYEENNDWFVVYENKAQSLTFHMNLWG